MSLPGFFFAGFRATRVVCIHMIDARQLAALYDRHAATLRLLACQYCDCPDDAVQETFFKLARQRSTILDPAGWLFRVARTTALDLGKAEWRRSKREAKVAESRSWFIEPDTTETMEVVTALQALPLEQREVIVARLWGGLTYQQVGEVVGCSQSAAQRRYEAGITQLRKILGEA